MPVKTNREYRSLTVLQPNQTKRLDTDYYVEGYATTYEPYLLYEYDGTKFYEQIDRNAFDGADMSDVIMQYDHEGRVMARQSNKTLFIEPDEHGLFIYADLGKSSTSRALYEDIDSGLITKMSWAFTIAEEDYDHDTRTRLIKRVKKVYDVSAVSLPANEGTEISARSFINGVIEKERQELAERKRKLLRIKLLMED